MRIRKRWLLRLGLVLSLATAVGLFVTWTSSASDSGAQHVRWDIISLTNGAPPGPINPGGNASASAPDGDTIKLTGSGTFVAPASGGGSGAVTGGGTWSTTANGGASGTYTVTG